MQYCYLAKKSMQSVLEEHVKLLARTLGELDELGTEDNGPNNEQC